MPVRHWTPIITDMEQAVAITQWSDEVIVERIREACDPHLTQELFQELFRRYNARVTDWCYRIVRNKDLSCDLAQEVFLRAYLRLDTFRGASRLSTWLYTITRNHCFNAMKRQSAHSTQILPIDLQGSDGTEVYRAVERKALFHELWARMRDVLTPLELRIVMLHYGYDVSLTDLTRRLRLSNPSGAKAFIVNARRKLTVAQRTHEHRIGVEHSRASACLAHRAAC